MSEAAEATNLAHGQVHRRAYGRAPRAIKRAIDIWAAAVGLMLLAPLLASAALAIRLTAGAPVLFRQTRPGRRGQPFAIVKFRTMRGPTDAHGRELSESERITWVGALLRRTSIDELPQLWNVLRGDMSLVGPRPLLMEYLDRYTPEDARRHLVRPGITGWAQVNGRQEIPFSRRLELDVWYVDHWTLLLDLRILGRTATRVFRMSGVRLGQEVTEFDDLGLHSATIAARAESVDRS